MFLVGPLIAPDTASYIEGDFTRPPLYPLLISSISHFNESENLWIIMGFQMLFGGYSAWSLCQWMANEYKTKPAINSILYFILISPYLTWDLWIGNYILSESLAYPLYLLVNRYIFEGIATKNIKPFLISLVITVFLVLTRKQFLFIYPAFLITCFIFINSKDSIRKISYIIIGVIISFSSATMIERVYTYVKHGYWAGIPVSGMQFITPQLYLANNKDISYITTNEAKHYFESVITELEQQGLTLDSSDPYILKSLGKYGLFSNNYNPILHAAIKHALKEADENKIVNDINLYTDKLMRGVAFELLKINIEKNIKIYVFNILNGFSGNFSVGMYYPLLLISITLLIIINLICIGNASLYLIWIVSFVMHLGNVMAVALVQPTMIRYTFYTSTILVLLSILFIGNGLIKDMSQNSKRNILN